MSDVSDDLTSADESFYEADWTSLSLAINCEVDSDI